MRPFKIVKLEKGQALTEMLLSLPILFIFAAGIIQFAILFLSYVQFEHSCGEAARQYCANLINKDSLSPKIYENLGFFQTYFDRQSLTVTTQQPRSTAAAALERARKAIQHIPFTVNYEGYEWAVDVKCKPPVFFKVLFPNGVNFHTVMQTYRYKR